MMRVHVYSKPDMSGAVQVWQVSDTLGATLVELLRTVEKERAVAVALGRQLEVERQQTVRAGEVPT